MVHERPPLTLWNDCPPPQPSVSRAPGYIANTFPLPLQIPVTVPHSLPLSWAVTFLLLPDAVVSTGTQSLESYVCLLLSTPKYISNTAVIRRIDEYKWQILSYLYFFIYPLWSNDVQVPQKFWELQIFRGHPCNFLHWKLRKQRLKHMTFLRLFSVMQKLRLEVKVSVNLLFFLSYIPILELHFKSPFKFNISGKVIVFDFKRFSWCSHLSTRKKRKISLASNSH